MLTLTPGEVTPILRDFGVLSPAAALTELQRYDYTEGGPDVRLILRADTEDGRRFVLRLRREPGVTRELAEAQSRFARLLRDRGVETPRVLRSEGLFAREYALNGYKVLANLEEFAPGELTLVDIPTAEETGALLARMHNIAEGENVHVDGPVLFDPLRRNDLFRFSAFTDMGSFLRETDGALYGEILRRYYALRGKIQALDRAPRYAVQGDVSDCNLYRTGEGKLGIFDFNNCGDNGLFADAVMQAVFEARLMDYPEDLQDREARILSAFLRGYLGERPFTREERELYPSLYGIITAFWLGDLQWGSLVKTGDREAVHARMEGILRTLTELPEMPV